MVQHKQADKKTDDSPESRLILIIEDDAALATLMERTLIREGFRVKKTASKSEIVADVISDKPYLLLLDYRLDSITAEDVITELADKGLSVPFVIVTGFGDENLAVTMMKLGAEDYLIKNSSFIERLPFSVKMIIGQLEVREQLAEATRILANSERNFRASVEDSRLPTLISDGAGYVLYANKAMMQLYGYSSVEDFTLFPASSRYTPDSWAALQQLRARRKAGDAIEFESITRDIVRTDGEIRHMEVYNTSVIWDGIQRLETIYNDKTDRHKAEERLLESENKYRNLVENAPVGLVLLNTNGEIIDSNRTALQMFGYESIKEFLTLNASYLYYDPLDRDRWLALSGEFGKVDAYEVRFKRKTGELFWAALNSIPSSRKEGEYIIVIQDITDRKRAEEALQYEKQRAEMYLNAAGVIMAVVDTDGIITLVNKEACSILGYTEEQLIGKNWFDTLVPERERQERRETYLQLVSGKRDIKKRESLLLTSDGREILGSFHNVTLRDTEGKIIGRLMSGEDITERKLTEEKIRQSEEFNAALLDNSLVPMSALNTDLSVRYVNRALERITGYSAGELVGKKPPYPWWRKNLTAERIKELEENASQVNVPREGLFEKKNGEKFWAEVTNTVVKTGQEEYLLGTWIDITERKNAERALAQNEEKYQSLIMDAPIAIIIMDGEGEIQEVNTEFLRMRGYKSREEFVATSLSDRFFDLDDRKFWLAAIQKEGMVTGIECQLKNRDGTLIWASLNSTPLPTDGPSPLFMTVIQDITEGKLAEAELSQASEEWRVTFDSISDLISIHDRDCNLIRVNKAFAETFGMAPEDLSGRRCYELMHGTDEPIFQCPHKRTLETRLPATDDFFEPHMGIHLEISTSPLFDFEGNVSATVHVARDISGRKRMEERLIVSDRMASLGGLVSGVAHEINNPLTSILGFSELMLKNFDLSEKVRENMDIIYREAERSTEIVQNLLTFARKQPQMKQRIDINRGLKDVLKLRAYEQGVNNIDVITRFDENLPEITGDGFQLNQVFLNIIINAEYFMVAAHSGGTITLTTERADESVRISISDTGPGISEEHLKHIFDPFFTTKEVGKGTGLGLSLSYGTVLEHNGRLMAESKPGQGAIFIIDLPIGDVDELSGDDFLQDIPE